MTKNKNDLLSFLYLSLPPIMNSLPKSVAKNIGATEP